MKRKLNRLAGSRLSRMPWTRNENWCRYADWRPNLYHQIKWVSSLVAVPSDLPLPPAGNNPCCQKHEAGKDTHTHTYIYIHTVRAHQLEASNAFTLRAQKPALTHGGQCDSFLWCCCSCCETERNNLSHRVAAFLDSACGDCCTPHSTLSMSDAASDDTERRSHGADDAAAAGGGRTPVAAAPPDPLPQLRAERQTLKHQLKVATKQIRNEAGPGFEEPLSWCSKNFFLWILDSKNLFLVCRRS